MTDKTTELENIRSEILRLTSEYSKKKHAQYLPGNINDQKFSSATDVVPYAGRVFDENEVVAGVDSVLDFWLTLGKEGDTFEKSLATYLNAKHSLLVNSGSSANLLAISALTSHKIPAEKRLRPGDEIITAAAGFPTTIAPIIQNGCIPVFIDNDPITGNPDFTALEEAYNPEKTKAVFCAHTLGNPYNLSLLIPFCKKYNLWLIEDNCDALGSTYGFPNSFAEEYSLSDRAISQTETSSYLTTGSFGDISTQSFYPAHHITLGEGGSVNIIKDFRLKKIIESFRDWGRDCWCSSGQDNTCNNRFGWRLGELPEGYDHKYIYSHIGYNLKPIDVQAAIGVEQLKKLPQFIQLRKENWSYLRQGLSDLEEFFTFSLPTHANSWNRGKFEWDNSGFESDCSWFGFFMRVKPGSFFSNTDLARALDQAKIGNRMVFAGNVIKQPAFVQLKKDNSDAFKVVGDLPGANAIMNEGIFLGTYPGLTQSMLDFEIETIQNFVAAQ